MEIDFVTSNPVKLRIANEVLNKYGVFARQRKLELSELQLFDIEEVALDKAKQAMIDAKRSFIISDDGFCIEALSDFPGALLKPVMAKLDDEKLLRLVKDSKNRNARFVNVIVFGDVKSKSFRVFSTVSKGTLTRKPLGSRKIGWSIERIFIPNGMNKTVAQLSDAEWDRFWEVYKKRLHYAKLGQWLRRA